MIENFSRSSRVRMYSVPASAWQSALASSRIFSSSRSTFFSVESETPSGRMTSCR
jgi:hypothetical protein